MIFILGGHGFVGSAFVRYCERHHLEYVVIGRDNYHQFVGQSCTILINANGNSKKFLARENPLADFDASVRSVRMSLTDFSADLYVYLSSCDVYPDCSSPTTTREDMLIHVHHQSPYGFHKYLAEQCVMHSARRWLILRLGGCVGPGMKKNPIFDILNGGPLWLDPKSELQYIETDEAARITFTVLNLGLEHQTINLCGKGLISLQEIIDLIGKPILVKPNSPRVRYDVSIEKLERLTSVPETRATVLAFVQAQLHARSA